MLIIHELRFILDSVGNGSLSEAPVPRFRKFSRDVLLHIQRQYSGKTVPVGKRGNAFPASTSRVSCNCACFDVYSHSSSLLSFLSASPPRCVRLCHSFLDLLNATCYIVNHPPDVTIMIGCGLHMENYKCTTM